MKLNDPKFVKAVETVANLRDVSSVAGILEIAQWLADAPTDTTEDNVVQLRRKPRVGDVVKIVSQDEWNDLRCRVVRVGIGGTVRLKPLQERPYGGRGEFLWHEDNLVRDIDYNVEW